ncbi:hypothetical protein HDU67_001459 [Dinochytrium kinnereticum]|nr:hypothetical protein HDU67_001459 [Dinochytrium kinnereticum]
MDSSIPPERDEPSETSSVAADASSKPEASPSTVGPPRRANPKAGAELSKLLAHAKLPVLKNYYLADLDGETRVFESGSIPLSNSLFLRKLKNCDITIDTTVTKVMVEDCIAITLRLKKRVITQMLEVWRSDDCKIEISSPIQTLQVDMCKNLDVFYEKKDDFASLVWAKSDDIHLRFGDCTGQEGMDAEGRFSTGFERFQAASPDFNAVLDLDQFIVRFLKGVLKVEVVIRVGGGYASTDREDGEAVKRKEMILEKVAETFFKNVDLKSLAAHVKKKARETEEEQKQNKRQKLDNSSAGPLDSKCCVTPKRLPFIRKNMFAAAPACLLAFLILIHSASSSSNIDKLLGVNPERKHLYTFSDASSKFTCLDGSKTVLAKAVNDDYCDCADGSDEPGTSACQNGTFYCLNEGHVPSTILSSRVNDGICDPECCDGSDEYGSGAKCPNVCKKIGSEFKKAEQQRKKILKEGLRIKNENVAFAAKSRADRRREIDDLTLQIANVTAKIEELKVIKADAEVFETQINAAKAKKLAQDNLKLLPDKINKCRESKTKLRMDIETLNGRVSQLRNALDHLTSLKDAEEGAAFQALLRDKPILKETYDMYDQYKQDHGTEDNPVAIDYEYEENDDVPVMEDDATASSSNADDVVFEDPCTDPTQSLTECITSSFHGVVKHFYLSLTAPVKWAGWRRAYRSFIGIFSTLAPSEEASMLRSDPPKARATLSEAEGSKGQLQGKLDELKRKEEMDYGIAGEWEKAVGKCITFDTAEYVYEICFHDRASQKSKNGGSTDMGRFSRFGPRSGSIDGPNKYLYMVFENGAHCWNGPARSVELELECGTEHKILAVTEPSKCEYAMKLKTPNACFEDTSSKSTADEHTEL